MTRIKRFLPFCFIFLALGLVRCSSSTNSPEDSVPKDAISIPVSAEPEKANYQTIQKQLEDAGFTNVSTQKIEDLKLGLLTKDGQVEKVTVAGEEDFSKGDYFPKDVAITIHYHTFKEDDDDKPEVKEEEQTEIEKSEEPKSEEISQVITADNPEFAAILANEDSNLTEAFAQKYTGKVLEFDGHIAHLAPHDNYKTRYNILIYGGDWAGENSTNYYGVAMKFENVAPTSQPFESLDGIALGQALHIKAQIKEFNRNQGLLKLEPIQITSR